MGDWVMMYAMLVSPYWIQLHDVPPGHLGMGEEGTRWAMWARMRNLRLYEDFVGA